MKDFRDQLQTSLGDSYRVERELGGGGMSRVFVAEEVRFQRRVVIKLLPVDIAEGVSAERFEREVMLAAQLQQANIVPVITAGDVLGVPYYTMPFIEGESLRAKLGGDQLPTNQAVVILRDVARALAYAHAHGIVHRDIKPENVLLSGGAAVVTDFGIAKAISASRTKAPGGTLTVVGTSLGTPAYMAPEQAVGDEVDHRADIYAWGVIAYEILAGAHPFAGKTTGQQLIAAHIAEQPKQLRQLRKNVPVALAGLVMSALEKSPEKRPQTAQDIVRALDNPALSSRFHAHQSSSALSGLPWPKLAVALLLVVLVLGGIFGRDGIAGLFGSSGDATRSTQTEAITTVAVLPFVNTSGNAQDEYFSDGMTDELAHALAGLPSIRVAARTSTYAFKGKSASVQEIGKALNVAGVIEGTVRRAGDRLRVTAQLTSAADGLVLWTDSYESRTTDVFQVQDQVTKEIVTALAPALGGTRAAAVAQESRGTEDLKAYDDYLKGRYFFAQRGSRALNESVTHLRRAIDADPGFARAHAGLALTLSVLPQYVTVNTDSVLTLAIRSGRRALELDSTVADAHVALGLAFTSRLDFAQSERHYKSALALEPANPTAHLWYGSDLELRGRLAEGLAELRRASELDPLSVVAGGNVALGMYLNRRYPEAIAQARTMLQLDSTHWTASYWILGLAHVFNGSPADGVRALERYQRGERTSPGTRGNLAFAYAAAGRWADAERIRTELERNPETVSSGDLLFLRLAYGDRKGALDALERMADRNEMIVGLSSPGCEPMADLLKEEPRYLALMRRLGLGVCPATTRWPIKPPPSR